MEIDFVNSVGCVLETSKAMDTKSSRHSNEKGE